MGFPTFKSPAIAVDEGALRNLYKCIFALILLSRNIFNTLVEIDLQLREMGYVSQKKEEEKKTTKKQFALSLGALRR